MPVGIRIQDIAMPNGGFVYLIEVQASPNKPHQHAKTYPVRLDGQSTSAPHYLVEMMLNQIKRPDLKGFLRVISYRIYDQPNEPFNRIYMRFAVTIVNISKTINDTDVYIQLKANAGSFAPPNETG